MIGFVLFIVILVLLFCKTDEDKTQNLNIKKNNNKTQKSKKINMIKDNEENARKVQKYGSISYTNNNDCTSDDDYEYLAEKFLHNNEDSNYDYSDNYEDFY